jgi:hypothetical protein
MLLLLEAYAPIVLPTRISGGKLIASYTMDDNGKLRRKMDALIEIEERQNEEDEKMIAALVAWWRRDA